jgi:hypothetical protein
VASLEETQGLLLRCMCVCVCVCVCVCCGRVVTALEETQGLLSRFDSVYHKLGYITQGVPLFQRVLWRCTGMCVCVRALASWTSLAQPTVCMNEAPPRCFFIHTHFGFTTAPPGDIVRKTSQ